MSNNFFQKSCPIGDNVKNYGRAGEATVDNIIKIIRRMRVACWKTEAQDINSEYVILITFPR